ncbi:MAG TPA: hypothetical protein PKE03_01470, partial [Bacteroidales bacterium]|nr:hypothetical protein [Bacteroidales bacterium]
MMQVRMMNMMRFAATKHRVFPKNGCIIPSASTILVRFSDSNTFHSASKTNLRVSKTNLRVSKTNLRVSKTNLRASKTN